MLSKRQPPLGSSTALTFRAERSSALTRNLSSENLNGLVPSRLLHEGCQNAPPQLPTLRSQFQGVLCSTPAYLGPYIRAFCRASSSSVHYAFSGVWSLAPPLRLRVRTGVFHRRAAPSHRPSLGRPLLPRFVLLSLLRRSCPRRVSTAGLGSSRLPLRPGLLGLCFLDEYDFCGCPADAGRRMPAGRRRPSPRGTLSLWFS